MQATWLSIGVFDGVHRGHQQIISRLTEGAHREHASAVVLTFWPHPASVLGQAVVRCLTLPDERLELLSALNVDAAIMHPFDRALAGLSALDFMKRLKQHLGIRHLVIGYDFALGKGREGNAARLIEIGRQLDYTVEVVAAVSDESGVISSTEIRKLVAVGDVAEAAKLLGHPYSLHGTVIQGDKRGRKLNFPTANIQSPEDKLIPANGIYSCWAWLGEERFEAAVNIGYRPTFHQEEGRPLVEAHLLDFDRDIYGQDLRLEFIARLRDELKFDSVEALIDEMGKDVARTRQILR